MEWVGIITALVALYGAALSTYTLVRNQREKRRQVRVKLSNGVLTYGPELSPAMLLIEATNPGNRTVILNTMGILLPDGKTVVFPQPESNVTFPHRLEEGNSCLAWTPMKDFAKRLRQTSYSGAVNLVGFYRDQIGNEYKSNVFGFNIDVWID